MTAALETVIGLALVYLLASSLVSAIVEYVAAVVRRRATMLRDALGTMLTNPDGILGHVLLKGAQPPGRDPSYVSPTLFAQAALEVTGDPKLDLVIDSLKKSPAVAALTGQAEAQQVALQRAVEQWFDDSMARWEGVYARWSQIVGLLVTLVLVPALNINTVTVAQALWASPALRADQLAATRPFLDGAPKQTTQVIPGQTVTQAQGALNALKLPIGWDMYRTSGPKAAWWIIALSSLPGWLISILAISAGSRFWFEALGRLVNLRLTGTPPPTARKT